MKKKIIALCLVAVIAVTALASITLAYFTDTDEKTNNFTAGKVDITLNEVFDEETAQLIPGVDIQKEVTISLSADSVESYVWYTYAIPAVLDHDDATYNVIHVNHAGRNWLGYQNDQKYWADGQTEATPDDQCWIVDYEVKKGVEIDGVLYNVYTGLYNGTLEAGEIGQSFTVRVEFLDDVNYPDEFDNDLAKGGELIFDLVVSATQATK